MEWYNHADTDSASAFNIGLIYDTRINDNKLAELWYKQAINLDTNNADAANNLAYLYEDNKEYKFAKKYYLSSSKLNNEHGMYNLAMLYENHFKNYKEAEKWYQKAIERALML
jgi:uncharacterized protein